MELLADKLDISSSKLSRQLPLLHQKGWMKKDKNVWNLTDEGIARALELVRAHRLWETYLVNTLGLKEDQIHADAERYEHILTPELAEEMDKQLGYPEKDPHGSPIPRNIRQKTDPKSE